MRLVTFVICLCLSICLGCKSSKQTSNEEEMHLRSAADNIMQEQDAKLATTGVRSIVISADSLLVVPSPSMTNGPGQKYYGVTLTLDDSLSSMLSLNNLQVQNHWEKEADDVIKEESETKWRRHLPAWVLIMCVGVFCVMAYLVRRWLRKG